MKFSKVITAGLLCVTVFCGCSTVSGETLHGNTAGNISNHGSAVEYKDNIYCQYGEKGEKLVMLDSTGKETVLKETIPYFINAIDNKIYYVDGNDGFRLHQMKIDGTEDKAITDTAAYYVNVAGNYIYYADATNGYKLYKLNRSNLESKLLSENNCQYINVTDDKIYYSNFSNGGAIYSCDLDGKNEKLLNTVQSLYINVVDDYIYYSAWVAEKGDYVDKRIYRMKTDGSENKVIGDCQAGDINVYNNKIYFTDWEKNNISVMNLDGTNKQVYDEKYGTYINIAGGKMFCVRYADKTKEMSLDITDFKLEETENGTNN